VLHCVAVNVVACCSVLQCVAVCCSVCCNACCSVCCSVCCRVLNSDTVHCSVLQWMSKDSGSGIVAFEVCCSVLQCVAVRCSVRSSVLNMISKESTHLTIRQVLWVSHVAHIQMSHVTHMNGLSHTYEWVMSRMCVLRRVTGMQIHYVYVLMQKTYAYLFCRCMYSYEYICCNCNTLQHTVCCRMWCIKMYLYMYACMYVNALRTHHAYFGINIYMCVKIRVYI